MNFRRKRLTYYGVRLCSCGEPLIQRILVVTEVIVMVQFLLVRLILLVLQGSVLLQIEALVELQELRELRSFWHVHTLCFEVLVKSSPWELLV